MMNSPIEEIKSRIDIVDLIQGYMKVQKAGVNFKAPCPFHGEKTPSFFVSPAKQIWHCFGCGRGGDIFKFVMEIEGHDFPEALKMLATRAGIELTREDPRIRSERNRLYDVCEEATRIFQQTLLRIPVAKHYLTKRGVRDAMIAEFRIGVSPDSWDFLIKALTQKGFRKEEVEKAGLAIKSQDGSSWYDRFRSRIMFPVTDPNGRVIGFGGRILDLGQKQNREEAKYINTPQTLLYDKSRALYALDKSKHQIRALNQVVIVEGYMDCVMSHAAGVTNTIAVAGTALTPDQLRILRRLCDMMISSFDTDAAGDTATRRSLALASEFDFKRKIAIIPAGKDPADAAAENPDLWRKAIADAQDIVPFYFSKACSQFDARTADGKKAIGAAVMPFIAELADEIEKAHWVGELARRLDIAETAIWKELSRYQAWGGRAIHPSEPDIEPVQPNRRRLLEERFLSLLPVVTPAVRSLQLSGHHIEFLDEQNRELFSRIGTAINNLNESTQDESLKVLSFKSEILNGALVDPDAEFLLCKRELERECLKDKLTRLGARIERAEKDGDKDAVAPLLVEFQSFSAILAEHR